MDSLNGILFKDWMHLLKTNHLNISGNMFSRTLGLTILSIMNSKDYKKEKKYHPEIIKTNLIQDPIFVLGHWRSGTTFLHTLLSRNQQFSYANVFEIRNPHTFITRQNIFDLRKKQNKPEARPTDNVLIDFASPGEEEFGVAIISKMSPLFGWAFPKNEEYYEKFSTFSEVSENKRESWKMSFHFFMQKLTFLHKKQLLLKSPLNTGRIKLLLELYPNAKFINIHRNPYTVFQSTINMYKTAVNESAFHKRDLNTIPDLIFQRYTEMYDAFFAHIKTIPTGNYVDIAFEDLEKDPQETVKHIYSKLQLTHSSDVEQRTAEYLESLKGFVKNRHQDLDQNIKERVYRKWERSFNEWGYSK